MDEEELREELANSIDDNSLEFWLLQIGQLCREKAEDARFDDGDETSAKAWDRAASAVEKCAVSNAVNEVS